MEIKTCLQDGRYTLVEFRDGGEGYVLLYDADQHSLFLGQEVKAVDLDAFWRKHQQDEAFCLPCELMLRFEKRWVCAPDYPPVELGIETGTARALIRAVIRSLRRGAANPPH